MIASIPVVAGINPVISVGSPLNEASTTSVVATPVALAVCAALHVAEPIAPAEIDSDPAATVLTGAACQVGGVAGPFEVSNCPGKPKPETVVGVRAPPPPRTIANAGN